MPVSNRQSSIFILQSVVEYEDNQDSCKEGQENGTNNQS